MSNGTLDRLMSDEQREKDAREERHARQNGLIIRATLVLLAALWIIGIIRDVTGAYVRIASIEAVGTTELCPGDELVYRYEYSAKGQGTLVVDATVWRTDPPQTIVFSDWRRFVLIGYRQETVTERWPVPHAYVDLATGQAKLPPPGNYERQFSITSANERDVGDTGLVSFSIRSNCP